MRISARNQLSGSVSALHEGAVNCQVVIDLEGGQQVVSIITLDSARALGLQVGSKVKALIKASDVMVGVD